MDAPSRLLIPAEFRHRYCCLAHSALALNGHRDVESSRLLLEPLVYWPEKLSDLIQFQQTCHFCQINATPRTVPGLPQGSLAAFHVLHRVSIDHIGPFPESPNHNKYLLVAIDHFTKYAWVFPVPDNTARVTASMLWHHIFSVFGTPEEIITDGASTLVADELRQLYALFHIEPLVSTAYYPQRCC